MNHPNLHFSENLKNLQSNYRPDTGRSQQEQRMVVVVERQEEKMDTDDDIYNTTAKSKYIKQAKNVSKSNADKLASQSETKLQRDSEKVEKVVTYSDKNSAQPKSASQKSGASGSKSSQSQTSKATVGGAKPVVHSQTALDHSEGRGPLSGKSSAKEYDRTSGAESKQSISNMNGHDKAYVIDSKQPARTVRIDKVVTVDNKTYKANNEGRHLSTFSDFRNAVLDESPDTSRSSVDESSVTTSQTTCTTCTSNTESSLPYDPLEMSAGHSESKYLKNKDSVKVSPQTEIKIHKTSPDSESPQSTPRDPKSSLFISTSRSSTYTVNLQAPNNQGEIMENYPEEHGGAHNNERKKVGQM